MSFASRVLRAPPAPNEERTIHPRHAMDKAFWSGFVCKDVVFRPLMSNTVGTEYRSFGPERLVRTRVFWSKGESAILIRSPFPS
jgi:hypothetical protein